MSLEDKIKKILGEASAKKEDDLDPKNAQADGQDVSDKDDAGCDDKNSDQTDVSKDTASVKESLVPGTDNVLGTKVSEKLKGSESEVSGAEKTSKTVAKYNKGTKQPKLDEPAKSGGSDEKASSETAKIKEKYSSSTMPKLKAEAFDALFNGETLSEDFKVKAETIFEAAVSQIVEERVGALQEEYQLQLSEAVEEAKGELVEQIDEYLDYVVEQWMKDNAVALESGIKVEASMGVIEKLKQVFEEHYIEIPENKVDVVESQATEIETLKAQLAEAVEISEIAINEAKILKCEAIIAEAADGLTAIESEKLKSLAENIEFDTEEEFATKVNTLKEAYFKQKPSVNEETQDTTKIDKLAESTNEVDAVLAVLRNGSLNKLIKSSN